MRTYTVVLSPDHEQGGYSVSVPALPGALPGAVSDGRTRDEALSNIKESMEGWLEVAIESGRDAQAETPELILADIAFTFSWRQEEGWPLLVETAQVCVDVPVPAR